MNKYFDLDPYYEYKPKYRYKYIYEPRNNIKVNVNCNDSTSSNNTSNNLQDFLLTQDIATPIRVPNIQVIPLPPNMLNIPDNDIIILPDSNALNFRPGVYSVSFIIVARIPDIAAPTIVPLRITGEFSGRPDIQYVASAYNNSNTATISASFIMQSFGGRGSNITFSNTTGAVIEILDIKISAYKLSNKNF